jgi:hypothetical protein
VEEMTREYAIRAGGWDPRYAVVRALVVEEDVAAVVVDPNGDGGSIDLDEYYRGTDGEWVAGGSGGGAGDAATSWSPVLVATYGRIAPGTRILIDYCDHANYVTADEEGWWLFATRSLDDHSLPTIRSTEQRD